MLEQWLLLQQYMMGLIYDGHVMGLTMASFIYDGPHLYMMGLIYI